MPRFLDSKDHPTERPGSATIGWTEGTKTYLLLIPAPTPDTPTKACARSGRFPRENTSSSTASSTTPTPSKDRLSVIDVLRRAASNLPAQWRGPEVFGNCWGVRVAAG